MSIFETFRAGGTSPKEVMRQNSFYRMNQFDRGQGGQEPSNSLISPYGSDALGAYSGPGGSNGFGLTDLEMELMLQQDWKGLGAVRYGDPNYFQKLSEYGHGNQWGAGSGTGNASGSSTGGSGVGGGGSSLTPNAIEPIASDTTIAPLAGGGTSSVTYGGSSAATGGTVSKAAAAWAKAKPYANAALQAYNAYSAAMEGKRGAKGSSEQYKIPYGNEYIAPLIRFILDQQAKIYNQRQGTYGGPQLDLSPIMAILAGVPSNYYGVGKP